MNEEITLRQKLKTWIEANFELQENKDTWFIKRKYEVIQIKIEAETNEKLENDGS
jgi:hypothetical protein